MNRLEDVDVERAVWLLSPTDGLVAALADVPDPVFSVGMLGAGCCVWPDEGVVCAPAAGVVGAAMPHAVGISTGDVEVLVHVGVDTVEMGGKGFELLVRQGQRVEAGQALVRFDREAVAAAGHSDCVVVTVTNSADMAAVELAAEPGAEIWSGEPLLRVIEE